MFVESVALATLNLGCNGIGDVGAGSLAGMLGQCSSLVTLVLAGNDIGDKGAERLAGALGQCSSLVRLSLRYNPIRKEVVITVKERRMMEQGG